jgi:hypothetical protein
LSGGIAVISDEEAELWSVIAGGRTPNKIEMNTRQKWSWLVGAFAVCFFAGGAIWWRGQYHDYLNGGFRWETIPLLAGVALFLTWIVGARIVADAVAVGLAFPAVVMARVVLDCIADPTRHNLWPLELIFAFGVGMATTFPSAALGWALRRFTHRSRT